MHNNVLKINGNPQIQNQKNNFFLASSLHLYEYIKILMNDQILSS